MAGRRRRKRKISQNPVAPSGMSGKLLGSGTVLVACATVVCAEEFVTEVVPSRLTPTVNANPLVASLVSVGIVPAASENILNANVLLEVETPSGELRARPRERYLKDEGLPKRESLEVIVEAGPVIEGKG